MQRYDRLREILRLDPEKDFLAIYRLTATYEFPWDFARALELALFRTYAVPSIGGLLAETGEFTDRSQKRYDDTALLLDAVVEHGFASDTARTAIRRVNQMHRSYDIGNDDMRYVLCTFVVIPTRWLDAYGWRPLTGHERRACANYYAALGRHLGITDIPDSYEEFEAFLDTYERTHFGWDEGGRKVADATLDLMASWYPKPLAPAVRRGSLALLDGPLLQAFCYEAPGPGVRRLVRGALRLRGRAVRLLPPRVTPHYARQNPEVKGYRGGYDVGELGTFPVPGSGGCPVPHPRRSAEADAQPPA
ncbi:oxygenase MpaB family protein [Streptomyces sp. NPDC091268]|uniref:oxygenase MpaB family protein n=1 Tax=Streptomyces sp. NPDC091268 TaxID=3365979 RepID=UPI0038197FD2